MSGKGHNFLKISWNTTRAVKGYRVERRTVSEEHSGQWTELFQGTKNNLKIGTFGMHAKSNLIKVRDTFMATPL